jgi:aspartate aminotransferase
MVTAYRERHDYLIEALNALPGVSCLPGDGAFYAFPCFKAALAQRSGLNDDIQLAGELLEQAGVAAVPGTAFGAPGHLRFSFATSMHQLESAIERLRRYLA